LAKPNYAFEKRQREIAKKKKSDAKQSKKRNTREEPGSAPAAHPGPQRSS
jgi:hypothetical protein